jgi:hypothetical protein
VACEGAGLTWVRRQVLTAVGSHGVLWVVGGLLRCIGGCRRVPTVRAVVAGVGGAWGYGQALTACGNRRRARAVRGGRRSALKAHGGSPVTRGSWVGVGDGWVS